jgi:hypothetical protein
VYVGETISVIASFGRSHRIKPVRFNWSGKLFEIKEITYTWKTEEGKKNIHHFSVTDGRTLYELTFDTNSLLWRLENLEA